MRTRLLPLALVAAFVAACDSSAPSSPDASEDRPNVTDANDVSVTPDVSASPDASDVPDATVAPDVLSPDAQTMPDGSETPDASMIDATPDGGCTPGMTRVCYSGSESSRAVGACRGGIQVCTPAGVFESSCFGEVVPASMETCGNGIDDDCNGMIDDTCGECTPGTTRDCYTGATGTVGVGRCRGGRQVCDATRHFGTCTGETTPAPTETCGNGIDDDCDGMVDDGCGECTPGTSRMCYSGADATAGVGRCRRGTQICNPSGAYDTACIGEAVPASTETCGNGVDDNCDGMVDNGCGVCTPGVSRACYSGPSDTLGVGRCRGGAQVCNTMRAYDATCAGETLPAAMETCGNGVDDDCDGAVDNGCGECTPGTSRACYSGASSTAGVGRCRRGTQVCNPTGAYDTACIGETTPAGSETCGNGVDDNCDGMVDNGCGECTPGASRACYSGPSDTLGFGRCRGGTQVCNSSRVYDTACTGEVTPASSDTCGNRIDDDCDGMVDEGCGVCTPGTSRACYSGASGTADVGRCVRGIQLCNSLSAYDTACLGEVTPASSETCGNGVDDDCDGMVDNGCGVCTPGTTRPCYSGAASTSGVGRCRSGTQVCNASRAYDAACTGEVTPATAETCGNGVDDDCDGTVDNGCGVCTPGTSRTCYTGPSGTAGVGRCARGLQLCNASRVYDTACLAEVTPGAEVCGNGVDENCDGTIDDGCGECVPGSSRVCYSGASGTSGRGLCRAGTQVCGSDRAWAMTCLGEVLPAAEICNGSDDDCNGAADDGAATTACALGNATAACISGACAVASCNPGYGNCDGVASNGCEALLTTSASNCGVCGRACGAGQTCTAGTCLSSATGVGSTVSSGSSQGCAVLPDGRVACWGLSDSGQLGGGTFTNRSSPQFVVGLSDAVSVSAGSSFTCALRATGAVSCWGYGLNGQLGDGTFATRNTALDATGIVDALQVSAGGGHACAVRRNGRVLCWGSNSNGQLGDGTTSARPVPSEVPGLSDVARVAAGSAHTCAVHTSGAVSCWGINAYSQLGDATTTQRTRPVVVPSLSNVTDIAAGAYHTCIVRAAGTMACWGYGPYGQLGDGSSGLVRATPSEVSAITDAVEVAVGQDHTCARRRDGTVSCWGLNSSGQLGDSSGSSRTSPVAVMSLTGVARIGAGTSTTCAMRTDGTVICWGVGTSGELGDGRLFTAFRPTFPVFGIPSVQACSGSGCALSLSLGDSHGCSVRPDGAVACWGNGTSLQLGDGSASSVRAAAIAVPGVAGATQVVAGADFSCARLASGGVRCWGQNGVGQIGDGTTSSRFAPTAVSLVTDAVEIASGANAQHACARTSTGTIYCWGLNTSGQIGDGSTGSRVIPTLAGGGGSPISDATAVAAGGLHTCAIRAGGALWCWGANGSGQLGDGTATSRTLPVPVRAADGATGVLVGVSQVSISGSNTCALRSGSVLCWGDNVAGQLGNGGTAPRSDPGTVPGISDAVEVRVGQGHACARRASGAVLCWGRNSSGQLGDGTTTSRTSPTAVTGIFDAVGMSAGGAFTCARRASGAVLCWGRNSEGQVANGTLTGTSAPGLAIFGLP